jgi:hypothetical protein
MTADNFCFYWQNRLIQTSQTGGQWYSDTSPFSILWFLPSFYQASRKFVGNDFRLRDNARIGHELAQQNI